MQIVDMIITISTLDTSNHKTDEVFTGIILYVCSFKCTSVPVITSSVVVESLKTDEETTALVLFYMCELSDVQVYWYSPHLCYMCDCTVFHAKLAGIEL